MVLVLTVLLATLAESALCCANHFLVNAQTQYTIEFDENALKRGLLRNRWVEVGSLPFALPSLDFGSPSIDHPTHPYVQAFFHASEMLRTMTDFLVAEGLPEPKTISISIRNDTYEHASFSIFSRTITHYISGNSLDPSILRHEIGHAIHETLSPYLKNIPSLPEPPLHSRNRLFAEGTADILAALASRNPIVGGRSIDSFIRFPDRTVTYKSFRLELLKSGNLSEDRKRNLLEFLESENFKEWWDLPEPYSSSAAINQPLWLAANKFGFDTMIRVYLRVLHELPFLDTYSALARKCVEVGTKWDPALGAFLQIEFQQRGLLPN